MPSLTAEVLIDFVSAIFRDAGVPGGEARIVAASLVGSNLRGHDSHGVMRVPQYVGFLEKGEYRTGVELLVEHETPAVVVCDGQWGFGQVQAHRLLERIVPKAKALGLASGTARDVGHIGRLGEYAETAAEQGLILIATVNNCGAGQRVAPPGGVQPRLGTNPLCAAVPTTGDPVVLDFGTSVVAEGKVRVYHINKKPVPDGWLLDPNGLPTTDPSVLYNPPLGSILPMGGAQAYKGFGLSLVLDMLDEEYLKTNLKGRRKDGSEITDEAAVVQTLIDSLKAVGELHRKRPEMDLTSLRPAVDKLAGNSNKSVQTEAKNAQKALDTK